MQIKPQEKSSGFGEYFAPAAKIGAITGTPAPGITPAVTAILAPRAPTFTFFFVSEYYNAISTMTVIIEAYDFMDDEINDMFDVAETAIDLRLD